ncbi:MAG: tetratricopeptide repeat protein [Nitrospinaceae bacterium]|nr:tetratricopeptide repeat protein [Nitrospinaceae bacterium]
MTLGHYEKAVAYFKKVLIYFKSFHLVSANLGDLYLKQKCYDEAMKHLKQSLVDMPTKLIGQIHRE